jgi:hypothetical protein
MSHFIYCCYAECHYAECRYAECHYAECRYAECGGALVAYIYAPSPFLNAKNAKRLLKCIEHNTNTYKDFTQRLFLKYQ